MIQASRPPWRYGLPIVLFGLGVALLIAEGNAGIAWTVIVGALALAATWAGDAASDERKAPGTREEARLPRGPERSRPDAS